jgi:hypothetical protein
MRQAYVTDLGQFEILRQQHIATFDVLVQNLQTAKVGCSDISLLRADLQLLMLCPTPTCLTVSISQNGTLCQQC